MGDFFFVEAAGLKMTLALKEKRKRLRTLKSIIKPRIWRIMTHLTITCTSVMVQSVNQHKKGQPAQ